MAGLAEQLLDKGAPAASRIAAAQAIGAVFSSDGSEHALWQAVCSVVGDAKDVLEVRLAALRAIAEKRAAAPNQLVRFFDGDPARALRKEAVTQLRRIGAAPLMAARLDEELRKAAGPDPMLPLANLAMTFGFDARIVDAYASALGSPDEKVRALAVRGLAMLGEMKPVMAALDDPSATVRASAAEMLGYYSTHADEEIRALGKGLRDADPSVEKAARTALKRMGIQPVAAPPSKPRLRKKGFEWRAFLEEWSGRWLRDARYVVELEDDVVRSGWLGFAPAPLDEIRACEARLGRALPPSYRAFLEATNGWRRTSPSVARLFPASGVDRFTVRNAQWVDTWITHAGSVSVDEHRASKDPAVLHSEYLRECVQVSDVEDGVYLLNPGVTTENGEWEAWFFASWLPGAERYPSFLELMKAEAARHPAP